MSQRIEELISNPVDLAADRPFGAIFGSSPSKGARSPLLWRAAYAGLGIGANFHPFDVTRENLAPLIEVLKRDRRFVGGACAVPFKEDLVGLLDGIEPEAGRIGAINALYRAEGGALWGANTDGAAALEALEQALEAPITGRKVLLLGLGGTGKAVATYLASGGAHLVLWNRTAAGADAAARKLGAAGGAVSAIAAVDGTALSDLDVLVNCTSSGYSASGVETPDMPLAPELIAALPDRALVYDIIYQPARTALLRAAGARGLRTLNGLAMNKGQAVIAFSKAFPQSDRVAVAAAMAQVP